MAIYIAYGANLNKRNMATRSPDAVPVGSTNLLGYKLIFNNVASIVPSDGDSVPVGLWRISEQDEKNLDVYEGFPHLYRKEYVDLSYMGMTQGLVYIMNYGGQAVPNKRYFDAIKEGYADFQLDTEQLLNAVIEAFDYEKEAGRFIQTRRGGRSWR